jgi:adenylate cyclase
MGDKLTNEEKLAEGWHKALAEGELPGQMLRRFFKRIPSAPRCGMCFAPFKGIGGTLFRPLGFTKPSRKNPNWCQVCFEESPHGGAEVDTGVLFADIRGFTSYSEGRAPEEVAQLANRFYAVASNVLAAHDAVIDKLVGDEVMALWVPGFAGRDHYIEKMISAADHLLRSVGYGSSDGPWLPIGIGLDRGIAFVGNIGSGDVKDFTAIGDVVNTAARLQSEARMGQIVMSERVYEDAHERYPDAAMVALELKGKSEPVGARVVDFAATAAVAS